MLIERYCNEGNMWDKSFMFRMENEVQEHEEPLPVILPDALDAFPSNICLFHTLSIIKSSNDPRGPLYPLSIAINIGSAIPVPQ
jgi:hypothetical protein